MNALTFILSNPMPFIRDFFHFLNSHSRKMFNFEKHFHLWYIGAVGQHTWLPEKKRSLCAFFCVPITKAY